MWIRLRVSESPVFIDELAGGGVSPSPLRDVFRKQPRELVLATGATIVVFALVLLGSSYLVSYGTAHVGLARTAVLGIGTVGGLTLALGDVIGALWSDRVGKRKVVKETRDHDLSDVVVASVASDRRPAPALLG